MSIFGYQRCNEQTVAVCGQDCRVHGPMDGADGWLQVRFRIITYSCIQGLLVNYKYQIRPIMSWWL